jgi:hypothetical protein
LIVPTGKFEKAWRRGANGCTSRDVGHDSDIGSDVDVIANYNFPDYHRACPYLDSIPKFRRLMTPSIGDRSNGHILSNEAIIADFCIMMNDDSTLVAEYHSPPNLGCVIHFDSIVIADISIQCYVEKPQDFPDDPRPSFYQPVTSYPITNTMRCQCAKTRLCPIPAMNYPILMKLPPKRS